MRISRKKRPEKLLIPHFRVNQDIRVPEVRIIDSEGNNVGVFSVADALKMAADQEVDLVEINPKAEPPVVQLLEFKHFKYQKEKEARKQKAHTHESEVKGIRLSIRIGDHDLMIKKNNAEKFLERGDKVKVELILRGAEVQKMDLALGVIDRLFKLIGQTTPVKYEQEAKRQGRKIMAVIARQ